MKRFLSFGAVLLLASVVARAEDARTFDRKLAEGGKAIVTSKRSLTLDIGITDLENKRSVQPVVSSSQERYEREVVKLDGAKVAKVKLHWTLQRNGEKETKGPLEGKDVVLERAGANVQASGDGLTQEQMAGLRLEEDYEALLPSGPVAVGKDWKLDHREVARFLLDNLAITPSQQGSGLCTFVKVEKQGGSDIAQVKISLDLSGSSQVGGWTMEATVQGMLAYDLTHGRPVSLTLNGEVRAKGEKRDAQGAVAARIDGNGNLTLAETWEPAK